MQVFKAALWVFFRHPVYIAIYMVALSMMALFIGIGSAPAPQGEFVSERADIAIIDRDGSELSRGLATFLNELSNPIEVKDSRLAMQDAAAKDQADFIMIIPNGFGKDFMSSALSASPAPVIETVVSADTIAANVMNVLIDEYLTTAHIYLKTGTATTLAEAVALASYSMENSVDVTMLIFGESGPVSQQWLIYMLFSSYSILLTIVVCAGLVLTTFNRTDLRRRNVSSPLSTVSFNMQIAAACVVVTLLVWVWMSALGLIAFGQSMSGVNLQVIALSLVALLAFAVVALAIGFLLGQLTNNELVLNAAGNITGLVLSFLGGVWLPLDFMGDTIKAITRFNPTFYYSDALTKIINLPDYSAGSLMPVFANMGILLLFALALFAVALVAGRLRMQSSEAGGNAAAAVPRH